MLLVGAMNPCPCGYFMSDKECRCKKIDIDRYINKLSGPLLDRFDIFVEVNSIPYDELIKSDNSQNSDVIRDRVEKARIIQNKRFENDLIKTNDEIKSSKLLDYCKLESDGLSTLNLILEKYKLSNRSYTKLLKVSRTIADLEESENINSSHIMEAFSFRKAYYTYFK